MKQPANSPGRVSFMEIITNSDFEQICSQERIKILKLGRGTLPKVYEKDNIIIKLFYPKQTRLSSNTIRPRALRFYKNCQRLLKKGYIAPKILDLQYCKERRIHVVHYQKIAGQDVRYLANNGQIEILKNVSQLIADLHHHGVYIRCIHLENLLYQTTGHCALIDVTDVRFKSKSLNIYTRFRNLKHLFSTREDKAIWNEYGIARFIADYFKAARLSNASQKILKYLIMHHV
jgi:tRNA A-37 threonylcarbamoyl transferase component Bud32